MSKLIALAALEILLIKPVGEVVPIPIDPDVENEVQEMIAPRVVKLDDPAQVLNAVFSTDPNPTCALVVE